MMHSRTRTGPQLPLSTRNNTLILIGASILCALCCVAAHFIRIPLPGTPVPFVLQPLGAFTSGILLGPWFGLLSQLLYIFMLPFTAWKHLGGITHLWGPTSGYMWGIVISSSIIGLLLPYCRSFIQRLALFATITLVCIHLPGMLVLRAWYESAQLPVPTWVGLIGQAIVPFLIGDTLKALSAAALNEVTRQQKTTL